MKKYKLGFIGCGNMAQAILRSLSSPAVQAALKSNGLRFIPAASDMDEAKVAAVSGVTYYADNAALTAESDFIFLAVKPQMAAAAVQGVDFGGKPVVSIMAGVNLAQLHTLTGSDKLVRVMPNLNARIGNSYNAYCTQGLDEDEETVVTCVLGAFGETARVDETQMNAITGITGSGPAFVFQFMKAFCEAGVRQGFDAATAKRMALATIIGSAYHVEATDFDLGDMVDAVCSKGGTTIQGVDYLKSVHFEENVVEAIERAIRRAEEMEKTK
ncbi:MAG: pyrroline-5-carboxylate reductase [Clostridia bacterium]|nr:pyrroline-5-carboxylate reductase [Clostridia bacterium]